MDVLFISTRGNHLSKKIIFKPFLLQMTIFLATALRNYFKLNADELQNLSVNGNTVNNLFIHFHYHRKYDLKT